ncbi:quinone-dependent dihydroorotate dehydrogenase [bacterium]|nr:quinone-dependent dihydroorotate dehydrogenase [bacterium]
MNAYRSLLAPLLFRFDPESVHHSAYYLLEQTGKLALTRHLLQRSFRVAPDTRLRQRIMGMDFAHPVGLAAGFDKDARVYQALGALGFSHVEIGTLTPKPQPGNDRPRLFRLKEDRALINRMGFNNEGVDRAAGRIAPGVRPLLGGNIGKNKATPNEQAAHDYCYALRALRGKVDYFTINISSPNTPGLRALQDKEPLSQLLEAIQLENHRQSPMPILLKLAPDLTETAMMEAAELVNEYRLDGVIATNTTLDRNGLKTPAPIIESLGAGGLSGAPLRHKSTEAVRLLRNTLGPEKIIVGVGGIFTASDVIEKLAAGADLVQLYTGFIYEGPGVIRNIVTELNHALETGQWIWRSRFSPPSSPRESGPEFAAV